MTKEQLYKSGDKCVTKHGRKITIFSVVPTNKQYVFKYTGVESCHTYMITHEQIDHEATVKLYTPSPKSLIKDGWMGVQRRGIKVWFIVSADTGVYNTGSCFNLTLEYNDNLEQNGWKHIDIMELYDNLGSLQWKREEKSAKDIEIERIQAEMNKLADDLSKLKGE